MQNRRIAVALACATLALAAGQAGVFAQGADDEALVIYSAGIDEILIDERDAALKKALHLLGERLAELPQEIGDPSMPPGEVFRLASDLFLGPFTLRLGILPDADPQAGPPFYAQINFDTEDEQEARRAADAVLQLVAQAMGEVAARPSPHAPGIHMIDIEGVPGYVGAAQIDGKNTFLIAVNRLSQEPGGLPDFGLPPGVRPVLALHYDTAKFRPLMEMAIQNAGPDAENMRAQFEAMGLLGDHPLRMDFALGHGDDAAHLAARYTNYVNNPIYSTLIATDPVGEEAIALVPADATIAQITSLKLSGLGEFIQRLLGQLPQGEFGEQDPFSKIEEETGVHPQRDLFAHLGEIYGYYMSDTTGGGGLLSTVLFVEVANREALRASLEKISATVNDLAMEKANGYVQIRRHEIAGREMVTLAFPGLPVPLEVSGAFAGDWWLIGATPQALVAALEHAERRDRSLLNHPQFRAATSGRLDRAVSVYFMDSPRLLRSGYGLMSLAASALSNAVKSRQDGSRDPGLVLPTYQALAKNPQAMVAIGWIEGNDLLSTGRMDRSMLVNATAMTGAFGPVYGAIVAGSVWAGVALPAVSTAREAAKATKSAIQLAQIHKAAVAYSRAHGDRYPPNVEELIRQNYINRDILASPFGPVYDGGYGLWFDFRGQEVSLDPERIIGYDRVMLKNSDVVNVLFEDGHVETPSTFEFIEMIEDPKYEGIDFQ